MRSPSQTTPTTAGPIVSPSTRPAVATVTEPRASAEVRSRNPAAPPSRSAYSAGLAKSHTESMSRTETSTTPKPVPDPRPRTSARGPSGSPPATVPTSSTSTATPSSPSFSASEPVPLPSSPAESPSISSPRHTTPTAPHSARDNRTAISRDATTAVTARLAASAAPTT